MKKIAEKETITKKRENESFIATDPGKMTNNAMSTNWKEYKGLFIIYGRGGGGLEIS